MEYTPIRIKTIKAQKALTFDLYIYYKSNYLRYLENNYVMEVELLKKLVIQKLARFYISVDHENNYQNYLDEILNAGIKDEKLPIDEKVDLLEGSTSVAVDEMHKDPTSERAYQMTEKAASNLRQVLFQSPEALKEIFSKKVANHDILVKHSFNVSALAMRLGSICELSEGEQNELAIAGLLHDVGISHLPEKLQYLFSKNPKNFTSEENLTYRTHPSMAISVLEKNPLVNQRILDLIVAHEEKISGTGYPLKKGKLTLQEEILSLANCYDKRVTCYDMSPKDAMKELNMDEMGHYNLETINKLKALLKQDGLLD